MGYDVSYHPINESEIRQWYFDALKSAREGDWSVAQRLTKEYGIEDFMRKNTSILLKSRLKPRTMRAFRRVMATYLLPCRDFLENTSTRAARRLAFWRRNMANLSSI